MELTLDQLKQLLPKNIKEKDINEMILAGMTQDEILNTINKNTFSGPKALLEFNIWRMR